LATEDPHKRAVNAEPTKDLFIEMLVRDIGLLPAVIDLVDNSVDGARAVVRGRASAASGSAGPGTLQGLFLRIRTSRESMELDDNCGGISLDDATNYAFRFGRVGGKNLERSIGQFGVAMKRAFFKLGGEFTVESVTPTSRFVLPVEVDEWRDEPGWVFTLREVAEGPQDLGQVGTRIRLAPLLPQVADEVGEPAFATRLLDEITARHQEAINEGLELSVDDIRAVESPSVLLRGSNIVPAYEEFQMPTATDPVRVRIVCGVGESQPGKAGWDVLCNGRTVLRSDQTQATGWGGSGRQFVPSYHNQFARFRGFAYFDSRDASTVPWTTTKTALDQDSLIWRAAKQRMVSLMRPVIDFLNELDREMDTEAGETEGPTLSEAVRTAKAVAVADLTSQAVFRYPKTSRAPRLGRIAYNRPKPLIEEAKEALDVSTGREVGERTFDYWVDAELG